MSARRIFSRGV